MSAQRKSATYLLILLLTAAPLANSVVDCGAQTVAGTAAPMASHEAHHTSASSVDVATEHRSHEGSDLHQQAENMASMDCCDDCLVMCTVAGGISLANAFAVLDLIVDGNVVLSTAPTAPRRDNHCSKRS